MLGFLYKPCHCLHFVKAGEWGKPLQCPGETMPSTSYLVSLWGKGERSNWYSWWVKQWVAEGRCDRREAGWLPGPAGLGLVAARLGGEIPGPLPASLGGKQLPMVLVSVTAECCSKGWSTLTGTDWALSHFLLHITPGKRENINETLELNGARSRVKCVKNFSQEIGLFGPFVLFHRHDLPGCMLFIFPWLPLFLFNP